MPAGTFLLKGRVEVLDGRLVFARGLTDLSHQVGLVAHVVPHRAWSVRALIDRLEYVLRRWAAGGTDRTRGGSVKIAAAKCDEFQHYEVQWHSN